MNVRNTKKLISGTNPYKEHLHYNEKEQNIKNIVFDPRQLFDPCQTFMDSSNPHYLRQNYQLIVFCFFVFFICTKRTLAIFERLGKTSSFIQLLNSNCSSLIIGDPHIHHVHELYSDLKSG